ncbi:MAG TPA: DUF2141 domain-containing protein [Myxococcales bacterium]|jgi:uncharacterized protein (DUF2141 family)
MKAQYGAALAVVLGGLLTMAPVSASEPEGKGGRLTLVVEITGFRNDRGNAKVALWHSREGFPADESKAVRRYLVPIVAGRAILTVENLEPGTWAIAAFHDDNDSGKIELGFLGIPKKGLGVSRDAKGFFGPPSFEAAKVVLGPGERRVSFRVVYY